MQATLTPAKYKKTMSVYLDIENLSNGPTNETDTGPDRLSLSSPPPPPPPPPAWSLIRKNPFMSRNSRTVNEIDYDSDNGSISFDFHQNQPSNVRTISLNSSVELSSDLNSTISTPIMSSTPQPPPLEIKIQKEPMPLSDIDSTTKLVRRNSLEFGPQLVPYEDDSMALGPTAPSTISTTSSLSSIRPKPIVTEQLPPPLEDEYIPLTSSKNVPNAIDPNKVPLNVDHNPLIIAKKPSQLIEQIQRIRVKYLKPPNSPPPGDIVIHQEPDIALPPVPPLVIVQPPPPPSSLSPPIVIRETPPEMPEPIGEIHLSLPGKVLPPPPRQVIVERFTPPPSPPPEIIHEKWLPYDESPPKRRVVYVPAPPVNLAPKPRNVLIEWEAPEVRIREQVENLGVHEVSEEEYAQFVLEAKAKAQAILTATPLKKPVPILYGDVDYLKLVDLKCHGLGEYEEQVRKRELQVVNCRNLNVKDGMWEKCECQNCNKQIVFNNSSNTNASIASVSVPIHASSDLTKQESHRHLNVEHLGLNLIL
jgi:hypothetical protein